VGVNIFKNVSFSRIYQRDMWDMGQHIRDAVEIELHPNNI
jgi:uncharacterized protein (UPF0303 family)